MFARGEKKKSETRVEQWRDRERQTEGQRDNGERIKGGNGSS